MKKLFLLIVSTLCLVLSINFVSAVASIYINADVINFGEINWDQTIYKEITIINNGTENLSSILLSSTASSSAYTVSFDSNNLNLSIGASKTVEIGLTLEKDYQNTEGGNKTIGYTVIKVKNNTSYNIPINITALPRLHISNMDVKVGSSTDSNIENNDFISKKAKPNDEIEFSVELENLFYKDDTEYDIEDVNVDVSIKEIDDGDDIEEQSDDFIIDSGSKKIASVKLTIPEIVKADTYDVVVDIQGRNSKNTSNKYHILWNLKLDVEKKKHDITIKNVELNPSVFDCGTSKLSLNVDLINLGTSYEDEAALEVKNSDLNINEKFSNIQLGVDFESDARYQKDIPIEIEDEFLVKGTYPITVNVYFDNTNLDDQKTVNLAIKECGVQAEVVPEQNDTAEESIVVQTPIEDINEEDKIEENTEEQINVVSQIPSVVIDSGGSNISKYLPVIGLFLVFAIIVVISFTVIIKR